MKGIVSAFIAGALFTVGLSLGGMTDPAKVTAFLDVAGAWDPSLAGVMIGALAVYAPLQRLIRRRPAPLFAASFSPLSKTRIEGTLILGSALFGIGWGLSGYCPGPALTSLGTGAGEAVLFVASMFAGIAVHELVVGKRAERRPGVEAA